MILTANIIVMCSVEIDTGTKKILSVTPDPKFMNTKVEIDGKDICLTVDRSLDYIDVRINTEVVDAQGNPAEMPEV